MLGYLVAVAFIPHENNDFKVSINGFFLMSLELINGNDTLITANIEVTI